MAEPVHEGQEEWLWLSPVVGVVVVLTIVAFWASATLGVPMEPIIRGYAVNAVVLMPFTVIIVAAVLTARAAFMRVESPIAAAIPFVRARLGAPALAAATIMPIVLTPLLMAAYGALKQLMPLVQPFAWDNSFAALGKLMFGGTRPWHWTHALFGAPLPTLAIDRIYTAWIPLLYVTVLLVAVLAPRQLRARYFLSFAGAWVLLGLIAAFLFPSAGPCYSTEVGSAATADYGDLMNRLRAIQAQGYQLGALDWQDVLWQAHVAKRYGFGMGVSAMPSMHNAICFLYVLAAWNARSWLRIGSRIFALLIFIGSIHLGWHYAVDGLAAWAGMAAIWWAAGYYLKLVGYRPAMERPAKLAGFGGAVQVPVAV